MEEVNAFASQYHEDSFATVEVNGESYLKTYKISMSHLGKFRNHCPLFHESLANQFEDEDDNHHSRLLNLYFESSEDVFELFLFWVSESRLPDLTADLGGEDETAKDERAGKLQDTLTELWLFADDYSIRKLQNDTMRSLLEFLGSSHVRPGQLREPLKLPRESQLQRAMMLEVAYDLLQGVYTATEENDFAELNAFFPPFVALSRGDGPLDPRKTSPSIYFARGGDISAFLVPEDNNEFRRLGG
ncbi:hypothetical protein KC338_g3556 [Hortaea werneckii]|nr:hypothetical protein KC323_g7763 [Hortaea werneckii]KAI6869323.1 hypothetical protein KC338_g3556 [Hortaea werneckii]